MSRISRRKAHAELSKEQKIQRAKEFMNIYARYSSLAFEMIVLIGGGAYGGFYLDKKYDTAPLWVVLGSVLGIALSFLVVYKTWRSIENYSKRKQSK